MTGRRLLPLVLGAATLLLAAPAGAASPSGRVVLQEDRALTLLERASVAGRSRTYSGLQFASAWRSGQTDASVADVRHAPGSGSVVAVRPAAGQRGADQLVGATADLDPRLLRSLVTHYRVEVAGREVCAGRGTQVVEARRLDSTVAGRFWVDDASGLLVRREVYDGAGALLRSSAFSSLEVDETAAPAIAPKTAGALSAAEISALRPGWRIPESLPNGLDLFDARLRPHGGSKVLHLSYTDGLSTLSVFAQRGRLGSSPIAGFREQDLAGAKVWATSGTPQRLVWSGSGQVFTLLSDAPADAVSAAVAALPHDDPPRTGLLARLGRGLARILSLLNPFD